MQAAAQSCLWPSRRSKRDRGSNKTAAAYGLLGTIAMPGRTIGGNVGKNVSNFEYPFAQGVVRGMCFRNNICMARERPTCAEAPESRDY